MKNWAEVLPKVFSSITQGYQNRYCSFENVFEYLLKVLTAYAKILSYLFIFLALSISASG